MDPYHYYYENSQDPRGFPILPQPYLYHHHPAAAATVGESRMRGGGRRRPGSKLSTDPQSVAARERRHRISDRFRVLRSLVPGGSKMDTVTMLEQAIHYVKFLKAQVSLHQAALVHHEEGCSHDGHEISLSAPPAPPVAGRRRGPDHDDVAVTVAQLVGGAPVQELAHQVQFLSAGHGLGQMSTAAHELPPLPSCVLDEEYACYSACNPHSEEADDVHGAY